MANSPAAENGIAAGDILISVDGKPAAAPALSEIEGLLQSQGIAHTLTLKRDGRLSIVHFTTRHLA